MDSFYDQPRRPPPVSRVLTSTTDNVLPTSIPDVSMLVQNKGNVPQKRAEMSYNAWKYQLRNKENLAASSKESILRKQVRFETPAPSINPQQRPPPTSYNVLPLRPTLVHKPAEAPRPSPPITPPHTDSGLPRNGAFNKILQEKPFEKLYIANIPSRNLDLSIIEAPKHLHRSNSAPGYLPPLPPQDYKIPSAESTNLELQKPQNAQQTRDDDMPTVRDLMKIIQQQNEQIMCLQKQVTTLLQERSSWQPQIKAAPKAEKEKFAIDVMTSFEVSIRGNRMNNRRGAPMIGETATATITEILDESSKSRPSDVSITLGEPVVVADERCPSPVNSVHVDMKDFSSEDEEESTTSSSSIGWTIYNNVMDQVNYMLKKTNQTDSDGGGSEEQFNGAVMKQVRDATLKHLQSVGVNLHHNEDDLIISSECAYTPTQVSFAVKQLLMKYLPSEKLANLNKQENNIQYNANYPRNLIKRRPDFSMATVQYMEKYNLLKTDGKPRKSPPNVIGNKMLDITALKQQPKLL